MGKPKVADIIKSGFAEIKPESGFYVWWFPQEEANALIEPLKEFIDADKLRKVQVEQIDGKTYYALYFGIASKKGGLLQRIKWHTAAINPHTAACVRSRTLSTLRQTICGLMGLPMVGTETQEKVDEICNLVPAFNRELDLRPGKTRQSKDYCIFMFKNGSYMDNIAARESSRGKRRHGGLVEECVGVDGTILSEVIIPTMNVSRLCMDGTMQPNETLNKSQIFVTTAGWKGTFAYDKLIQFLVWMVTEPEKAIIMGGTWRIPVLVKLLDKTFLQDLKKDGTFNEASFDREYESKWSGTIEDAFFNGDAFDKNRTLQKPEYEHSGRSSVQSFYVVSADIGRKGCDTVACVFKVTPQSMGAAIKSLVNIYTFSDEHFENQAIQLKKLYYKYKARRLVIDGNGLGIGLVDYMVKTQTDPVTNDVYPDFGVYNDEDQYYKKYRTDHTEDNAMYIVKANAPINTEAHSNAQVQLTSGKVKLLIDERVAKTKLLGTKVGQNMKPEERAEYLKPFTLTSILKDEMLNLREENEGVNIILKQYNKGIRKDKFSAFEYGLYYIKQEEENKKKKKRFNAAEWKLFN